MESVLGRTTYAAVPQAECSSQEDFEEQHGHICNKRGHRNFQERPLYRVLFTHSLVGVTTMVATLCLAAAFQRQSSERECVTRFSTWCKSEEQQRIHGDL